MPYTNTVALLIFNNAIEASIVQDRLTLNGIPSFLEDENVLGLNPSGGVQLRVFSEDKYKAQQILAEEKSS
jgi:hypothetical protein